MAIITKNSDLYRTVIHIKQKLRDEKLRCGCMVSQLHNKRALKSFDTHVNGKVIFEIFEMLRWGGTCYQPTFARVWIWHWCFHFQLYKKRYLPVVWAELSFIPLKVSKMVVIMNFWEIQLDTSIALVESQSNHKVTSFFYNFKTSYKET